MKETKFKQTEIGDIPVDWEVKTIREAFRILPNNTLSRDCLNYSKGDYYNIHYGDVLIKFPEYTDCKIEEIPHINDGSSFNKTVLHDGDIVMADTAEDETAGKMTEIFNSQEMKIVSGLHTIPMRPLIEFAPKWLGFSMNCSLYHNQLLPLQCGTKVTSVSKSAIADTMIAYPSTVEEQERIAEALSDVDGLLRELDGVIAKKRAIKQGAMQELLTGKRRLEGFTGEWEEKKLGKVVDFQRGQVLTSAQYVTGNVPVVAGGKTFAGYHNKPNRKGKTICISASGAYAGFVSYYEIPIFASDCSTIGEGKNYDIRFVYYFLLAHQDDIYKMQTGGAQPHIHPKDVAPMDFHYPKDIEEQTAIANILSDMDEEIAALEAKRAKYEQVKQGMMQELLTGKIRLV